MREINYSTLPDHMQQAARVYIERGIPPGSFLTAVMSNQLVDAFARADDANSAAMFNWAAFLRNEVPIGAWGSEGNVEEWIKRGGLEGMLAQ